MMNVFQNRWFGAGHVLPLFFHISKLSSSYYIIYMVLKLVNVLIVVQDDGRTLTKKLGNLGHACIQYIMWPKR